MISNMLGWRLLTCGETENNQYFELYGYSTWQRFMFTYMNDVYAKPLFDDWGLWWLCASINQEYEEAERLLSI